MRSLRYRELIYACGIRCAGYIADREGHGRRLRECADRIRADVGSLGFLTRGESERFASGLLALMREAHRLAGPARIGRDLDGIAPKVLSLLEPGIRRLCRRIAESSFGRMAERDALRMLRDSGTVLYYVPGHPDPAADHADLQGHWYVDADWRSKIDDPTLRLGIARFAREKKAMSVQEAIGAPHWLTTRPNCRHRFVPVPVADALSGRMPKGTGRDLNERIGDARTYDKRRAYVGWRFAEAVLSGMGCPAMRRIAAERRRGYAESRRGM